MAQLSAVIILWASIALASTRSASASAIPAHRYQLEPAEHFPFVYGVASGDPFAESVLLWTYAKIANGDRITWSVWLPATGSFENNVTSGEAALFDSNGNTVTVEAVGLAPNTVYNYAFEYQGNRSRIGRTRTAPRPDDDTFTEMKVAVMSCSRVWNGFFNAYREVALRDDLHLVLHVVREVFLSNVHMFLDVCGDVLEICFPGGLALSGFRAAALRESAQRSM